MRLLITGSRDWTDRVTIMQQLLDVARDYGDEVVLVSGACPTGADKICEDMARVFGWTVEQHPADWETHGKAAGPLRNKQMVRLGADLCLAFIKDNSRGASHCADLAEKANIRTVRFEKDTTSPSD